MEEVCCAGTLAPQGGEPQSKPMEAGYGMRRHEKKKGGPRRISCDRTQQSHLEHEGTPTRSINKVLHVCNLAKRSMLDASLPPHLLHLAHVEH